MGIFELFGKNDFNEVGTVNASRVNYRVIPTVAVIIKGIVSLCIISIIELVFIIFLDIAIIGNVVLIPYLLIAFFAEINPNYNNLGLFGGLIDHPFRYTDDLNRMMVFLRIFLMPGRFISKSVFGFLVGIIVIGKADKKNN